MPSFKNMLLVYPRVPGKTYWSFEYALKFIGKKSAMPPLGLITVASFFPEKYNLKLIDLNIEPLTDKDIIWADMVFISVMIVQKKSMEEVIALCVQFGKKVAVGGPYPTNCYNEITGVDHFILGEVEDTFCNILNDLENNRAKKVYEKPSLPDISRSVIPRFDLLKTKKYASMSIQCSRGCPFKCEFCDIWKIYGNKPRLKSSKNILEELDFLYNMGWRGSLFIVDDNFIGNKSKLKKELLPNMIKWQKDHGDVFNFYTEASIDLAKDEKLLTLMRKAGFGEVFLGIETPSKKALEETGKYQNLKIDLFEAVDIIQKHGIEVMAGFILGFDSDTEDIFNRQIEFIQKTGIPKAMVGLLTALPKTDLYNRLKKENRILCTSSGNNTHKLELNYKTIMDRKKLIEGYKKVLSVIYDSNLKNYFKRCTDLLNKINSPKYQQRKITVHEVIMLVKSLVIQPFTPYGIEYIKFITRNLIFNRNIFGEAIRFSIIGHHFHTITQETIKINRIESELETEYSKIKEKMNICLSGLAKNSNDSTRAIIELWKDSKKTLLKIKHKINKIHKDFREEVLNHYNDVSSKTLILFSAYKKI